MNYEMSLQEVQEIALSENYIKKAALFYYSMNDYNQSAIADSIANRSQPISFVSSGSTGGFKWERDHMLFRFCPDQDE